MTTQNIDSADPKKSVVITGIGVVAPTGLGAQAHWETTLAARSAIGPIQQFSAESYPVGLAGEVSDFVASDHVPRRLLPQTDRGTHMGLTAASFALADAEIDPSQQTPYAMGVITANASGGNEFGQRELQNLWSKGPQHVTAYQSIAWFYAATTGQISIQHGMKASCGVIATEQAGGLDALAQARQLVRNSDASAVITGGTEAPLTPYALTCQITSGLLSRQADAARAYCPFDVDASGFVPGEGGAMFVVEDAAFARARGATTYGEIAGYAATFDPRPGSQRPPGLRRAIEGALRDAELNPSDVDVVFADGMGVTEMDRIEAAALVDVFGPHAVPVTVPKTMTGRLYAGGAALDVATALLSMRDSTIPPTVGIAALASTCKIWLVRDVPQHSPVRVVLIIARGFGGFNSALVLRANSSPHKPSRKG